MKVKCTAVGNTSVFTSYDMTGMFVYGYELQAEYHSEKIYEIPPNGRMQIGAWYVAGPERTRPVVIHGPARVKIINIVPWFPGSTGFVEMEVEKM